MPIVSFFIGYLIKISIMKKFLVIATILIGYQIHADGQNWDLFPKEQYSMFELSFYNQPSFIERVVNDSTKVYNDSTVCYFNSKWIGCAKCSSVIDKKDLNDGYSNSYLQLDTCVKKNNWQYFNYSDYSGSVNFKFDGHAKVNDSWSISENISIKCDSVSQRLIFGQLDSVKYFSNNKVSIPFILSKNFGLVEFAPFRQLIYANAFDVGKVKLIGFEKNENKVGITIPEFKDFFHLKTGDIIFWNYHYDPWDPREPTINYYYKDSITQSMITNDSVIYEINTIRDSYITKDKQSYYKNNLANFLNPNSSMGLFSDNNPYGFHTDKLMYWQCMSIVRDSSVFSLSFNWSSLLLDSTNCSLGRIVDAGSYFSLNTKVGLSSFNESTVVGAIINGEKWGMTNIPTSISETNNSLFRIYPNPCKDKLFIQQNSPERFDYRLFNINGQLIKCGQLKADYIDMSDLPHGLYNLQISNDKIHITSKIIKLSNR